MEAIIVHKGNGTRIGGTRRVLSSWKEISAYLGRGIRTVQRYEAQFGLPIHRPVALERGYVFAFSDELDDWLRRKPVLGATPNSDSAGSNGDAALGNFSVYSNAEFPATQSAQLPTLNSNQVRSMRQGLLRLRETLGLMACEKGLTPRHESHSPILEELLHTAIEITNADFGNVQLLDPESRALRIVCQRGFGPGFLRFFSEVQHGSAACGSAMQNRERIVVEDVMTDPIYTDEARNVMIGANALACQSTPFFDQSGKLLGVLSTHYRVPTRPTPSSLRLLDNLLGKVASSHVLPLSQSA